MEQDEERAELFAQWREARECAARIAKRIEWMEQRRPLIKVETGYIVVDRHE